MENLKNVAPIEDFNWDAYENGEAVTNASHEELEKAYDGTLNKVNDREVVDGTVIAMNKREVVVNIFDIGISGHYRISSIRLINWSKRNWVSRGPPQASGWNWTVNTGAFS